MKDKKRIIKNIVMVVVLICLIGALLFTSGLLGMKKGFGSGGPGGQMPGQEQMQDDSDPNSQTQSNPTELSDSAQSDQSGNVQPPSDANGQSSDSSDQSGDTQSEPPELPDGAQSGQSGNMQPPSDMPSGQPGDMPSGMPGGQSIIKTILTFAEALMIALIIVFLIMSRFNKKGFRETLPSKKKIIVFAVVSVLAGGAIGVAGTLLPGKIMMATMGQPGQMQENNGDVQSSEPSESVDSTDATEADDENTSK